MVGLLSSDCSFNFVHLCNKIYYNNDNNKLKCKKQYIITNFWQSSVFCEKLVIIYYFTIMAHGVKDIKIKYKSLCTEIQGGSNMTGTDYV